MLQSDDENEKAINYILLKSHWMNEKRLTQKIKNAANQSFFNESNSDKLNNKQNNFYELQVSTQLNSNI